MNRISAAVKMAALWVGVGAPVTIAVNETGKSYTAKVVRIIRSD